MAKINAKTFAAKFRSKSECWQFLAIECGAFLPSFHCVTIWHLKQIISTQKKCKCIGR